MVRKKTRTTSRSTGKARTARARPASGAKGRAKRDGSQSKRPAVKKKTAGKGLVVKLRKSPPSKAAPKSGAARRARGARAKARVVAPAVPGVAVKGRMAARYDEVLTAPALVFLADLHRRFDRGRKQLLAARSAQQRRYDAGARPDFLAETRHIRSGGWTIAPIPKDLLDRRVEITGPVDRKMIVNALNSDANVFMADFEDANSPTWANNDRGPDQSEGPLVGKTRFRR